jgi:hypothetical protein
LFSFELVLNAVVKWRDRKIRQKAAYKPCKLRKKIRILSVNVWYYPQKHAFLTESALVLIR